MYTISLNTPVITYLVYELVVNTDFKATADADLWAHRSARIPTQFVSNISNHCLEL